MTDITKCQVCNGFFPSNAYGETRKTTAYDVSGETAYTCGTGCAMVYLNRIENQRKKEQEKNIKKQDGDKKNPKRSIKLLVQNFFKRHVSSAKK